MSETNSYPNTYVESVEWQRDKAYARAEKLAAALREIADPEGRLGTERMSTIAARALAENERKDKGQSKP